MKLNKSIYLQQHLPDRVLYDPDFPVILLHSPKAGCTTLVKWFFYQLDLLEEAQTKFSHVHAYKVKQFNMNPRFIQNVEKAVLANEKPVFKLVRNPFSRAVSCFIHFSKAILLYKINNLTLQSNWARAKKQFPLHEGITFKEFLYFLKKEIAEGVPIDPHINGQYVKGEELLVTRLIKLEQLESQVADWERGYGLKPSPFKELSNSSHHNDGSMTVQGSFADQVITTFHLTQGLPTLSSFYDPVTIGLVREIYKREFKLYGYSQKLP